MSVAPQKDDVIRSVVAYDLDLEVRSLAFAMYEDRRTGGTLRFGPPRVLHATNKQIPVHFELRKDTQRESDGNHAR